MGGQQVTYSHQTSEQHRMIVFENWWKNACCIGVMLGGFLGGIENAEAIFNESKKKFRRPVPQQVLAGAGNSAPTAIAPAGQPVITNEDTPVNIQLEGDDPDGDTMTFQVSTPPVHGSLVFLSGNSCTPLAPATSCSVIGTYTPTLNYFGPDVFRFLVNDGAQDSSDAGVKISVSAVNDPPVLQLPPSPQTVAEGTLLTFPVGATDVDDPLSSLSCSAGILPIGATFTPTTPPVAGNCGIFSWVPGYNQANPPGQSWTLTFLASDGGSSTQGTVQAVVTDNVAFPDLDLDGIPDSDDNCPTVANSEQEDEDADGFGNLCDIATPSGPATEDLAVTDSFPDPPTGGTGYPTGTLPIIHTTTTFYPADLPGPETNNCRTGIAESYWTVQPLFWNLRLTLYDGAGVPLVQHKVPEPKGVVLVDTEDPETDGLYSDLRCIYEPTTMAFDLDLSWYYDRLPDGVYTWDVSWRNWSTDTMLDRTEPDGVTCVPGSDECFPKNSILLGVAGESSGGFTIGDQCPNSEGDIEGTGCPYAVQADVLLHSVNLGPGGSTKAPLGSVQIRVFDQSSQAFIDAEAAAATEVGVNSNPNNPNGSLYAILWELGAQAGMVGTCVTGADGICYAGVEAPGEYLVIAKYSNSVDGNSSDGLKRVYTGKTIGTNSFKPNIAEFNVQIIQVNKNGVFQGYQGGNKTVVTGSILEIISPTQTVWDGSTHLYPFIFTSDSPWTVDICSEVPTGYAIRGIYDESGALVTTNACVQTFVSGEEKVVAFEVEDVGSPEPSLISDLVVISPKGKKTKIKIKTEDIRMKIVNGVVTKLKYKDKDKDKEKDKDKHKH